jgi:hypothetical protein
MGHAKACERSYAVSVPEDNPIEVKFFVGEWIPTSELIELVREEREPSYDEDGVEFLQPKRPPKAGS